MVWISEAVKHNPLNVRRIGAVAIQFEFIARPCQDCCVQFEHFYLPYPQPICGNKDVGANTKNSNYFFHHQAHLQMSFVMVQYLKMGKILSFPMHLSTCAQMVVELITTIDDLTPRLSPLTHSGGTMMNQKALPLTLAFISLINPIVIFSLSLIHYWITGHPLPF